MVDLSKLGSGRTSLEKHQCKDMKRLARGACKFLTHRFSGTEAHTAHLHLCLCMCMAIKALSL